ncbi:hypothetical protein SY2F82_41160 [Streptomyces sp. Y2F8-2]|nr:hypothetical protein SY2F82_41160 [Streptomyces sp. Y2F8-2]
MTTRTAALATAAEEMRVPVTETVPAAVAAHTGAPPRRRVLRALRTHFGTVAGALILGVLLWRLGTGVLLDGLRRIDVPTLLAGLGIGALTTVFSAWRWCRVAHALGMRLPFGAAVADYYRALFLNAALPGGVLGDVHRAVRHGQSAGDVGRGVRAVVLERAAGQVALVAVGVPVLLTLPSPVLTQARHLAGLTALATLGALAIVVAVRMGRTPRPSRRRRALGAALTEARTALLARGSWPSVLLSSVVVLAGHLLMFLVAARVAGSHASPVTLLPLALLALIAMGLPLNIGGFGPREGVTAWAFGAAGLGADTGLGVAVLYGVLSFVASLPGLLVLLARWYTGLRHPRTATENAAEEDQAPAAPSRPPVPGAERFPHALRAPRPHTRRGRYAPAPFLTRGHRRCVTPSSSPSDPTREKYGSKDSASVASNCFPLSAEASEGRPMTPDSV